MANERSENGRGPRSIWGILLLILVVFVVPSLFSYDWTDISLLKAREAQVPQNMIGPVGAWLAFVLFMTFGVGAYLVPLWLLLAGLVLVISREPRVWPRVTWCTAMILTAMLIQEFYDDEWASVRASLNIGFYTSGIWGWLLMKSLLVKWLKPVGAGILVWSGFAVSLVMFVGMRSILSWSRSGWTWLTQVKGGVRDLVSKPLDKRQLLELQERELEKQRRRLEKIVTRQQRREAREPEEQPEPARSRPAQRPEPTAAAPSPAAEPAPRRKEEPPPAPGTRAEEEVRVSKLLGKDYRLPPVDLLDPIQPSKDRAIKTDTSITAKILTETLKEFGIEAEVTNVERGPVVTRYELLPAPGIRVERISSLSNNLALSLKATSVRVQAPVPGKGVVGIEVPNSIANMVYFREILEGDEWKSGKARLPLALGQDVGGKDMVADLTEMPHLLVAGATGSGKTVCMNSMLLGLLMSRRPDELRLMLVDPKIVEFSCYNGLPHLVVPVITNPKKVGLGLRWAINEMEKRYKLFARTGVRNIEGFNHRVIARQEDLFGDGQPDERKPDEIPDKVPYIVIVIDELADLMLVDQAGIENSIARLAQLSRAVGIHMILSTQRPSVNVITGTIKANFPARIGFQVAQKVDSRTILDTSGADKLLGRGDMLFLPPGTSKLVRAQGALATDEEIARVVDFLRQQGEPVYEMGIKEKLEKTGAAGDEEEDSDEMLDQAVDIIRETRRASTSSLQRRLRIGYTRAARIMDILEQRGVVGPPRGSDPREILIDLDGEIPDNSGAADTAEPADEKQAE